jgi:pyruvate/2-oxoglutarate dehydrogenase complex dihydrolipoamide dehydrogenase (E3) component
VGWKVGTERPEHDWTKMINRINDNTKGTNFVYRTTLMNDEVKYYNKLAKLKSKHEIEVF